jgi:hypothetical protein
VRRFNWPHLMVKIQQETEIQNSWMLMVIGTLNSASIDICTQTYTLSADDFEISVVMYPNPNRGVLMFSLLVNRQTA